MKNLDLSLILGGNGLVGSKVIQILGQKGYPWKGFCYSRGDGKNLLDPLNLTHFDEVKTKINLLRPQVIYHCANLKGGVNYCENHPQEATLFHYESTQNLGRIAQELKAHFVFISTDYVFGNSDQSLKETDLPHPMNLYGKLKLQSENWIKENVESYTIVRTTNVYDWDPFSITPNYFMQVYQGLAQNKTFQAPSYLWGTPTYAEDLARILIHLGSHRMKGLFHVVGPDYINRYDWGLKMAEYFQFNQQHLEEKNESDNQGPARPSRVRLDTTKINQLDILPLKGVWQGFEAIKKRQDQNLNGIQNVQ